MKKALLLFISSLTTVLALEPNPNIVFILADDLGYGDIACYGCPDAKTPNIDRLAAEGVKFTNFYANGPECTPTRTAIMTGRYPQFAGGLECAIGTGNVGRYDDAIRLAQQSQLGLPVKQAVIPRVFTKAGYATGIFGKWHLGYEPHFNPLKYGWDKFFGCLGGNVDYFTHKELSELPVLFKNDKPVERKGYMTHLITDEALQFIKENQKQPFFCYIPFTTPHFPFQTPADKDKKFTRENWTAGSRESYVAMLEDLDNAVGQILGSIESLNLGKNTLVIFASDHGAMKPGRNLPWNGFKGGLFEGGIRAPLIARWPGKIKPGTLCRQLGATFDLTASFARITGSQLPPRKLDGIDLLACAEKELKPVARNLYWRAKRGDRTWWATLSNDGSATRKYIRKREGGDVQEWLFNITEDPGESKNLFALPGNYGHKLKQQLATWETRVKPLR
ncbi:MAG: sulfatase-like hydrolase/transferase [Verrucomicrobiaceae bacterium]|nr:sulfatase-like hydrolase/transferase [Verrucomicrobiaceae bacterium]